MSNEKKKLKILSVDDERGIQLSLKRILTDFADLTFAKDSKETFEHLAKESFDAVLLDVSMPEISGLEILPSLKKKYPDLPVVMVTSDIDYNTAVEAIQNGASEYVAKDPDKLPVELPMRITRAIERERLINQNTKLKRKLEFTTPQSFIIGNSKPIIAQRELLDSLKGKEATVLITGPSGSGKEVIAEYLHQLELSENPERPFITLNCAAIPEDLAESELFGHEKGSYTGADKTKGGLILEANGGDLFLDEIGDLSPKIQAKLLRVLQEKELRPVGATREIGFNLRLICATNKDLQEEVRLGRFRKDLYYRIAVLLVKTVPLNERRDDIVILAKHFLETQFQTPRLTLSPSAQTYLEKYDWPGNVRQLRNTIERAWILASSSPTKTIEIEHISFDSVEGANGDVHLIVPRDIYPMNEDELTPSGFQKFLSWFERQYFLNGLKITRGNKSRFAGRLDFSRETIYRKLKLFGLDPEANEELL